MREIPDAVCCPKAWLPVHLLMPADTRLDFARDPRCQQEQAAHHSDQDCQSSIAESAGHCEEQDRRTARLLG